MKMMKRDADSPKGQEELSSQAELKKDLESKAWLWPGKKAGFIQAEVYKYEPAATTNQLNSLYVFPSCCSYNLGSGAANVVVNGSFNDGKWHRVKAVR